MNDIYYKTFSENGHNFSPHTPANAQYVNDLSDTNHHEYKNSPRKTYFALFMKKIFLFYHFVT